MTLLSAVPRAFAPFEPDDVKPFLRKGMVTLLSQDFTQPSDRVRKFFDRDTVTCGRDTLLCHFGFQTEPEAISFGSWLQLDEVFRQDRGYLYSSDFYFETVSESMFGYCAPGPASLAILTVNPELLDQSDLEVWDSAFEEEINEVGFGRAGDDYVRALLTDFPKPRRTQFLSAIKGRED